MKKLKSLKTLSSLGATIAITPIVATACNNDDDTVEKVNVKIYNWKNTGEYYSLMNQQQVVDEFISQNKAGENDIPADIYDYITVSSSGEGINRTILVEVTKSNDLYGGRTSIDLEVEKVDINHFTWFKTGKYVATMTNDQVKQEFLNNNIAGRYDLPANIYQNVDVIASGSLLNRQIKVQTSSRSIYYEGIAEFNLTVEKTNIDSYSWNDKGIYFVTMSQTEVEQEFLSNNIAGTKDLPKDIYDSNNVSVNASWNGKAWVINVKTDASSVLYQGNLTFTPVLVGTMVYDNKTYSLASEIDLNCFCWDTQTQSITVETKEEGLLTISDPTKLTSLNLPNIIDIEKNTINDNFLFGFSNLTELNLSMISVPLSIGNNFLSGCTSLTELNLNVSGQIKSIGSNFLYNCSSLKTFDFPEEIKVSQIADSFMEGCASLEEFSFPKVDWQGFSDIGKNFLFGCTSLVSFSFQSKIRQINIKENFLSGCTSLKSFDCQPESTVSTLDNNFMANCTSLKNVNLSLFNQTKAIKDDFLSGCSTLELLDLSPFVKIETIGNNFLSGCTNLKVLNLKYLANVKTIGNSFLANDTTLVALDFSPLNQIQSIGNDFLNGCSSLEYLNIDKWSIETTVGDNFLLNSTNLRTIELPMANDLDTHQLADAIESNIAKETWWTTINIGVFVVYSDAQQQTRWQQLLNYTELLTTNFIIPKGTGCMTFKNIRYLLAEGVDPNIFVGNDTWTVPVQDYDPVSIAVNERDKLTQLRFTGNPIKKIKDNFLGGCTSLRALEITSLYETTEIGSNFLSSCSSLNYLNLSTWTKVITIKSSFLDQCVSLDQLMLFNIDPKNITVDQDMFMNNVPNNCVLCAKDFVDQYQKTSPWSQRKDYIIE